MLISSYVVVVAVRTVFKIVFTVVCGIILSPYLSDPKRSEKGFSFMAVRILLPCMLFGNLCQDISIEFLSQYYWAVVMSFIPMILGAIASFACFGLVSREYRVLVMLGSTFQNGLLFPLSVVTNIRGIAWLDERAVNECQQYVFLYNLCCALGLWSLGGPMVKHFKDKVVQDQEDAAEELYYERRKQRNMKRFVRELKERVRRQENRGHTLSAPATTEMRGVVSSTQDATPALMAEFVQEISEVMQQQQQQQAELQETEPQAQTQHGRTADRCDGPEFSPTATSATNPEPAPLEDATTEDRIVKEEEGEVGPARTRDDDDDSITNDIIAQFRKHFGRKPDTGVVFPQLQVPGESTADPTAAATIANASPTAATATPTTTVMVVGSSGTRVLVERPANGSDIRSSRRRGTDDAAATTAEQDEVLLGADARPTVQGQLRWYRPARRKARPIDVAKFDRWKELMAAKQGQGPDAPLRIEGMDASLAPEPLQFRLDERTVITPPPELLAEVVGTADDAWSPTTAAPVAFPPALGEGIYSDRTDNILDEEAVRRKALAEEAKQQRRLHGGATRDPQEEAEAAAAQAFSYSDFHTLAVSPPATPPPEANQDGNDLLVRDADRGCAHRWKQFKGFFLFAIQTPAVYITFLAVLVSTFPPLRWCSETYLGIAAIKGIALVGTACVPFQLVALGCTLASKKDEAAPLVLQENLESEDENTSGDEMEAGGNMERREGDNTPSHTRRGGGREDSAPASGPSTVKREIANQASAEAILAAQPAFDVNATIDAQAAAMTSHPSNAITLHASTTGPSAKNATADENRHQKVERGGYISRRKAQKQLRNIALRRKREMLAAMGALRRFWHQIPDATRFTYIVLFLRLLLLPAVSFLLVHWLIRLGIMPLDRPFIVSILIGVSSPAAVNASLVCTINDYHAGEFSRMIFLMYCLAAVTSTTWLALSISYTSAFVPEKVIPTHPEDW